MRILPAVPLTPEQITVLVDSRPGFVLIRGAAGSGKTTTALMRLRQLCATWLTRKRRLELSGPVRVLVLTYNRTLSGYITELARQQIADDPDLHLEIHTFAKWAVHTIETPRILTSEETKDILRSLCRPLGIDVDFLMEEVDYVLGRFKPEHLADYISCRRQGRGLSPRLEATMRARLLDEVIRPYQAEKVNRGVWDWNDLAVHTAGTIPDQADQWDIVIIDEAQDISANQVRAVQAHLADNFSATFIIDAAQRIYPRSFPWREVGMSFSSANIHVLRRNYRNTRQIAHFARTLIEGLPAEDDGTLPDFTASEIDGPLPVVVSGLYHQQLDYIINFIDESVDLATESVAFLKPKGGAWFSEVKRALNQAGIEWVTITAVDTWPAGDEAVALSTLYSAKGLEFDHVIIPGLSQQMTPHGPEDGDAQLDQLRRLIAMGVGRARKTVTIGYKPEERSTIVGLFDPDSYTLIEY